MSWFPQNEQSAAGRDIAVIESKLVELENIIRTTEQRLFDLQNEKNSKKTEMEKIICGKIQSLAKEGNDALQILNKWKPNNKLVSSSSHFTNITQMVVKKFNIFNYSELVESNHDAALAIIESTLLEIRNNERLTEQRLFELQNEKEILKNELEQVVTQKIDRLKKSAEQTFARYNEWYANEKI